MLMAELEPTDSNALTSRPNRSLTEKAEDVIFKKIELTAGGRVFMYVSMYACMYV